MLNFRVHDHGPHYHKSLASPFLKPSVMTNFNSKSNKDKKIRNKFIFLVFIIKNGYNLYIFVMKEQI